MHQRFYRIFNKCFAFFQLLGVALLIFSFGASELAAQQDTSYLDVTVDGDDVGREFYGLGANSNTNARLLVDYPEPERSEVLDFLYKPGYGASLQILKVEITGGTNTTAGSDPSHMPKRDKVDCNRGYNWWLMKEAKKRNPDIILYGQQWSAPGWLDGVWTEDNIEYHLTFLECAEKHGLEIDFIGGWNEKGFDPSWFVALDSALDKHYPDVRIPAPDAIYQDSSEWTVVDSMIAYPDFKDAVDQIAMHWPCQWRTKYRDCPSPKGARDLGIPLQMTNAGMGHDVGGPPNTRGFNRMYIDGKFTSYLIWNTGEAYYSNLPIGNSGIMQARWPWSGFYDVGKNIWAFAHTTQFTEPGWHYIDSGSKRLSDDKMTATMVSLADPSGEDYSMIIEAMDLRQKDTLYIQLKNLPNKPLDLWTSNMASDDTSRHFQKREGPIVPHDGRFRLVIRPGHVYSLTTTSGQGKGAAKPEVKTAYQEQPLPFSDDFDDYEVGETARLFTNLHGVFEVTTCEDRPGKCYRQMVDQEPIIWNKLGEMDPTLMVGEPRWSGDYTLSTKALLDEPGYVELIGRINGQRPWTSLLGGYHFRIGTNGWALYSEDPATQEHDTLAEGSASITPGQWHDLAFKMNGNDLELRVDGETIKTLENSRQRAGNVGLRTSKWNNTQFDEVRVEATSPTPQFLAPEKVSIANVSSAGDFWMGWTFEPEYAIDRRPETRWHSENHPRPHSITLDVGKKRDIEGLWLRPRFDKTNGLITEYRIEASTDGREFETVDEGGWPVNSSTQVISWPEKVTARFIRLTAVDYVGNQASISEIKVITDMAE